jgi:hypothetical protein
MAAISTAEPVVARFPVYNADGSNLLFQRFYFHDYDTRLPDLLVVTHNAGAFGVAELQPALENNTPDYMDPGTSDNLGALVTTHNDPSWFLYEQNTAPGTAVPGPDATGTWVDPGVISEGSYTDMPVLRFFDWESYNAGSCHYAQSTSEIRELSSVWHYPLRVELAAGIYLYGWMAVQPIDVKSFDCEFPCEGPNDPNCMKPLLRYIAVGFETEPNTPIVSGGGLCPADLNFDAVLDLADVQAFAVAFTGMQPAADFDENGIYDLADIQAFITGFSTNCGL